MEFIRCKKCLGKGTTAIRDLFKRETCTRCSGTGEQDASIVTKPKQRTIKFRIREKKFMDVEKERMVIGI